MDPFLPFSLHIFSENRVYAHVVAFQSFTSSSILPVGLGSQVTEFTLKNGSLLQSISQSSEHFSFLMPTLRIFIIRLCLNTEVFEQIHSAYQIPSVCSPPCSAHSRCALPSAEWMEEPCSKPVLHRTLVFSKIMMIFGLVDSPTW